MMKKILLVVCEPSSLIETLDFISGLIRKKMEKKQKQSLTSVRNQTKIERERERESKKGNIHE